MTAYSLNIGAHPLGLKCKIACSLLIVACSISRPLLEHATDFKPAGQAHTDFAEAKLQRRLIEGSLEDNEIDALSVVALAGAAAEAMQYEEVCLIFWAVRHFSGYAPSTKTIK